MEPSYKARKIIERCLLILLFGMVLWAGTAQFSSSLARALTSTPKKEVHFTILTSPIMELVYNPASQKTVVSVRSEKYNPKKREKYLPSGNGRFLIPQTTDREKYWNQFKETLASWRYNPLLIVQTVWGYITAWHDRRTNLTPAEFLLLSMELTKLDPADFAVRLPAASRAKATRKPAVSSPAIEDMAPLAVKDRPIVVEIFNASGQRGLALALTQYLREQNEKELLRVDVIQYDNYPSYQDESFIVDYSGRLVQVKQLSRAIGINSEIKSETSPNAICDTRIVLGKDFEMPL